MVTKNLFNQFFIDLVNAAYETKFLFVDRCHHILQSSKSIYVYLPILLLVLDTGTCASLDSFCHHQIMYCKENFNLPLPPPFERKIWHYHMANTTFLKRSMSSFPWIQHLNTADILTVFSERIYNLLDAGREMRAIALDISKAFNKVWHAGLLHKLKAYGVVGTILSILESFSQERSLKVVGQSSPMLEFLRDQFWGQLYSLFLLMIFLTRFYLE